MAVIAALIDGPGPRQGRLHGLTNLNVGQAAVPGLLIVVIAIVLDRTTTAASDVARGHRAGSPPCRDRA